MAEDLKYTVKDFLIPTKEKLFGVAVVFILIEVGLWIILAFFDEVLHFYFNTYRFLASQILLEYFAVCILVNYVHKRHGLVKDFLIPTKEKLFGVAVVYLAGLIMTRAVAPLLDVFAVTVRFRTSFDTVIVYLILLYFAVCLLVSYLYKQHGLVAH